MPTERRRREDMGGEPRGYSRDGKIERGSRGVEEERGRKRERQEERKGERKLEHLYQGEKEKEKEKEREGKEEKGKGEEEERGSGGRRGHSRKEQNNWRKASCQEKPGPPLQWNGDGSRSEKKEKAVQEGAGKAQKDKGEFKCHHRKRYFGGFFRRFQKSHRTRSSHRPFKDCENFAIGARAFSQPGPSHDGSIRDGAWGEQLGAGRRGSTSHCVSLQQAPPDEPLVGRGGPRSNNDRLCGGPAHLGPTSRSPGHSTPKIQVFGIGRGQPWQMAQKLELVPPPEPQVSTRSEQQLARKESKMDSQTKAPLYIGGKNSTKGKTKDKTKDKGKGKNNKEGDKKA